MLATRRFVRRILHAMRAPEAHSTVIRRKCEARINTTDCMNEGSIAVELPLRIVVGVAHVVTLIKFALAIAHGLMGALGRAPGHVSAIMTLRPRLAEGEGLGVWLGHARMSVLESTMDIPFLPIR